MLAPCYNCHVPVEADSLAHSPACGCRWVEGCDHLLCETCWGEAAEDVGRYQDRGRGGVNPGQRRTRGWDHRGGDPAI